MPRPRLEEPQPHLKRITGRRKWYVAWTDPGTRRSRVESTGTEDEDEAKAYLADFLEDLAAPPETATIAELLDARLKEAKGRVVETKRMEQFHKQLKAHLGSLRPSQITKLQVREYAKDRGHKIPSIKRELEELRAALRLAHDSGWIDSVPKFTIPANRPPRERFMSREDAPKLIAAAKAFHVRLFIALAMLSGHRKGAILDLTWDRVDLEHRRINFQNPERQVTKKRRGVVPIDDRGCALLKEAKKDARTEHVIEFNGRPVKDIKKGFAVAAEAAGLAWVTPHLLKHSVISWLAEDDHSVDRIADLTETDAKTVRRIYRKVNPDYLEGPCASLAEIVFAPTVFAETPRNNGCS